jgi:hypothetical protein
MPGGPRRFVPGGEPRPVDGCSDCSGLGSIPGRWRAADLTASPDSDLTSRSLKQPADCGRPADYWSNSADIRCRTAGDEADWRLRNHRSAQVPSSEPFHRLRASSSRSPPRCLTRSAAVLLLTALFAGCGSGSSSTSAWNGRRGYDGNGDYGYDLVASRAEANGYRARAARAYAVSGTLDDPWGPHVREAAHRFQLPERWIREVMRQESGGRPYDGGGMPITSGAGAMGLMQVMPRTYDTLQRRHGLGSDPYEPRDNILAGTAYIRAMYDRYGAPGFLAAYNAGPDRVDLYLAGSTVLADETVNYLARVAPRLGTEMAMNGPFTTPALGYRQASASEADLAYADGGMTAADYYASSRTVPLADNTSLRAFEGGGLVTPEAPTGVLTGRPRTW